MQNVKKQPVEYKNVSIDKKTIDKLQKDKSIDYFYIKYN